MKLLPMAHPYFLKNVFIMLEVFVETFSAPPHQNDAEYVSNNGNSKFSLLRLTEL